MSMSIPSNFDVDLGLDINGVPTSYSFGISSLPKINMGLDPIEIRPIDIGITSLPKINIGLDPIEIRPLDVSLQIKVAPTRVSTPANFKICLGMFGIELASIRLCGQGQVIAEPYVANPCECGGVPSRSGVVSPTGGPPSPPVR